MTVNKSNVKWTVTQAIQAAVAKSGKSAGEIAQTTGTGSELTWGMFIAGKTKLPPNRVVPFCAAVGADPAHLARVMLEDYFAPLVDLLQVIGRPLPLTANEERLIKSLREITGGTDAQVVVADGRDLIAVVMA